MQDHCQRGWCRSPHATPRGATTLDRAVFILCCICICIVDLQGGWVNRVVKLKRNRTPKHQSHSVREELWSKMDRMRMSSGEDEDVDSHLPRDHSQAARESPWGEPGPGHPSASRTTTATSPHGFKRSKLKQLLRKQCRAVLSS